VVLDSLPAPRKSRPSFAEITRPSAPDVEAAPIVFELEKLEVYYGGFRAVRDVSLEIRKNHITAFIGPSGCGKTTVLRCLNRMNDLVPGARVSGGVRYHGTDLYGPDVAATEVRRRIGMVFQKPNPFPQSIYENVAFGPRINGVRDKRQLAEIVEKALQGAALWRDVRDRLHHSALGLSGGQQQRLCIARTIAVEPEVVLMDEPCSALDPIATAKIEELMRDLATRFTIVIVTHNMQQAARISDRTAFFTVHEGSGTLVEYGATKQLFAHPREERTEAYITGRFG